jgi:hypothetical protein
MSSKDELLNPQIETAINYAARDVARAIADTTGGHRYFASILRNVSGMLRGVAAGAVKASQDSAWTSSADGCWWLARQADTGPGGLDKNALSAAVREWWDALDDAGKYKAIIGKKPERGDQFVNEKIQHFQNKTEQELASEDPKLLEAYRRAKPAGAAAPAAPAPAAPTAKPAPVEKPIGQEAPAEPAEKPEQRPIFEGAKPQPRAR